MKYSSMFCCCAPLLQCSRDKKKYSCLQSVSRAEPRAGFHVFLEGFTLRWCFCLAFIGIYEHQHQVGSCHPDHVWMKITNRRTELRACSLLVFPALHSSFPQACRFIPSPCCSEIVQRNVNSRLVRLCENAPPEAMTLSISATFRC